MKSEMMEPTMPMEPTPITDEILKYCFVKLEWYVNEATLGRDRALVKHARRMELDRRELIELLRDASNVYTLQMVRDKADSEAFKWWMELHRKVGDALNRFGG